MSKPNNHSTGSHLDRSAPRSTTFEVVDPATERVIGTAPDMTAADAIEVVERAHRAQPAWASITPRERSEILARAHAMLLDEASQVASLIVAENGKPYAEALAEVTYAAEFFRWYAEEAVRLNGSLTRAPGGSYRIMVQHESVGVALLVTPWNLPAAMVTRKIAPALAAGCTVVIKPATDTPLTALAIIEILSRCGVPDGVVNIVTTTRNAAVVEAMLADRRIRKLSFTGSTAVGRVLLVQAAERVLNVSMELGGNAPFVVLDDADLDLACAGAIVAKMRHNAQACTAANRFIVHREVVGEFTRRLTESMSGLRTGPGCDPRTAVGPLINAAAVARMERLVSGARDRGATVTCGGRRREGAGYFFPPTVLADCPADAEILEHEIFGPVAPIVTFDTVDEAVGIANASDHGLMSYVYTQDLRRALALADRLEAGMVGINRAVVSDPAAPFGGVKHSGIGREGGHDGIIAFTEPKYIAVDW